jgi:hypothetical protein
VVTADVAVKKPIPIFEERCLRGGENPQREKTDRKVRVRQA